MRSKANLGITHTENPYKGEPVCRLKEIPHPPPPRELMRSKLPKFYKEVREQAVALVSDMHNFFVKKTNGSGTVRTGLTRLSTNNVDKFCLYELLNLTGAYLFFFDNRARNKIFLRNPNCLAPRWDDGLYGLTKFL